MLRASFSGGGWKSVPLVHLDPFVPNRKSESGTMLIVIVAAKRNFGSSEYHEFLDNGARLSTQSAGCVSQFAILIRTNLPPTGNA